MYYNDLNNKIIIYSKNIYFGVAILNASSVGP